MALTETQTSLISHYKLYLGGILPDSPPNQTYAQWNAKTDADKEEDLKNWTNDIAKPFVESKIIECGDNEEAASMKVQLEAMLVVINAALTEWGL